MIRILEGRRLSNTEQEERFVKAEGRRLFLKETALLASGVGALLIPGLSLTGALANDETLIEASYTEFHMTQDSYEVGSRFECEFVIESSSEIEQYRPVLCRTRDDDHGVWWQNLVWVRMKISTQYHASVKESCKFAGESTFISETRIDQRSETFKIVAT